MADVSLAARLAPMSPVRVAIAGSSGSVGTQTLDVVRAEVDALGGRIETTSVWGKGTQFKLVVPLTTAVTQVVMLRLGDRSVGVPS